MAGKEKIVIWYLFWEDLNQNQGQNEKRSEIKQHLVT